MKIEGYFSNIKTAKETVEKLKNAGLTKAIIDINDHYIEKRNVHTNVPSTQTAISLSGLVLESDDYGESGDKAPLKAASPMVSGMGTFDEIADVNCKVVVDCGQSDENRVKQMIKSMGGDLESPYIKTPKIDEGGKIPI